MGVSTAPAPRRPSLVLSCLACVLLAQHADIPSARAAEYVVDPAGGTAFSTLAGAVAAAPSGAIIRLRPGLYAETVTITKDLALVGTDQGQGAVLAGEGRRALLRIGGAVTCRIENLAFRNGLGDPEAPVRIDGGAVADFINCSFLDNTGRGDGGAALVTGAATWSEFLGCHFQHNRALGDAGALAVTDGAEVTIRGCTFFGNTAEGDGGALTVRSATPLTVEDSLFIENRGYRAGAILGPEASGRIAGNTFFQNLSYGGATVVAGEAETADCVVTNNIFAGDLDGAGLSCGIAGRHGCNIYFDNLGGPLRQGRPGPDDLVTDPGFCDFRSLDLSLRRNSPAAGRASACGRIGALDVGCLEGLEATVGDPRRRVH